MSDPQSEILVALMRSRRPLTIAELATTTGRARSTVRNNLHVMAHMGTRLRPDPWVATADTKAWRLTDKGREVARFRARRT